MVRPVNEHRIEYEAAKFADEFKLRFGESTSQSGDTFVFFTLIFHLDVFVKAGIKSPNDLKRVAKAKVSERKKQYEAMGGASGAGFSEDEFERVCRVAREIL